MGSFNVTDEGLFFCMKFVLSPLFRNNFGDKFVLIVTSKLQQLIAENYFRIQ